MADAPRGTTHKPVEFLGNPSKFQSEVVEAIDAVRVASARVVEVTAAASGGQPIRKASHLQRALGVPVTIAWQVFRMASARELLAEAQTVPGPRAVEGLARAARSRGVRGEPLDALAEAVQRFENLVRESAGDRDTFNAIVAALLEEPDREREASLREVSPSFSVEVEPFDRRLDRAVFRERLLARLSLAIASLGARVLGRGGRALDRGGGGSVPPPWRRAIHVRRIHLDR